MRVLRIMRTHPASHSREPGPHITNEVQGRRGGAPPLPHLRHLETTAKVHAITSRGFVRSGKEAASYTCRAITLENHCEGAMLSAYKGRCGAAGRWHATPTPPSPWKPWQTTGKGPCPLRVPCYHLTIFLGVISPLLLLSSQ